MSQHSKFTARLLVALVLVVSASSPAHAYWRFKKGTNTDSDLQWCWLNAMDRIQCTIDWRSGSGVTTNPCEVGKGWLPNGWYDLWGHWNHYDHTIKGRVFYLQNKQCSNGTWRTELFIHTEETASNGQSCPTGNDDPYCWEGANDYKSAGCIKVNHGTTMPDVHWYFHNKPDGANGHGSYTNTNILTVTNP